MEMLDSLIAYPFNYNDKMKFNYLSVFLKRLYLDRRLHVALDRSFVFYCDFN